MSCVDSAIFSVRSPWVIARAPAFSAFMATVVKAEGLEVTLLEGWGELEPERLDPTWLEPKWLEQIIKVLLIIILIRLILVLLLLLVLRLRLLRPRLWPQQRRREIALRLRRKRSLATSTTQDPLRLRMLRQVLRRTER